MDEFDSESRVRSFVFFSAHHLVAATYAALRAHEIEKSRDLNGQSEYRSQVLGAIVFSVAFLETCINELFVLSSTDQDPVEGLRPVDQNALKAVWCENTESLSVLRKFDLALAVCQRAPFDKGQSPLQDVAILMRLRNIIVHYKEGWLEEGESHKIESALSGKFAGNVFADKYPYLPPFPMRYLSYGCAKWAITTVRIFADDFYKRLGCAPYYQIAVMPNGGTLPVGS